MFPVSLPRVVVVPAKPPAVAKSRLAGLGDDVRRDLVVAFASDTVAAAVAAPSVRGVVAVTDDHAFARALAGLGAAVIPDGAADDLNATLVQGAAEALRRWPGCAPVALCADLPCLRVEELERALAAAPAGAAFVADRQGRGTTLLAAPDLASFDPRFGAGSREAHLSAGALEITATGIESVRRDVDTPEDLAEAVALGVGSSTTAALARHRL